MQDASLNQIAGKLQNAFFAYFRYNPSPGEVNSWRNSLRALSQTFQYAGLDDHGVILEYQLPLTSRRLDCLICGRDEKRRDNAVIIELKQWDRCKDCASENEVLTFVGGSEREVLHPSVQVCGYKMYLEDTHTAFNEGNNVILLNACTYLHNYNYDPSDPIFAEKFKDYLVAYPLFTADDVEKLSDYLTGKLELGQGLDVLQRVEQSKYRPSKKLMDHVAQMIRNRREYILLDEQQVVFDKVLAVARQGFHDRQKTVIIVKGGPGTGKSLIAINLMADLSSKGYNSQYTTGSQAFTETLRNKIGTRGAAQFTYFNSYLEAEPNEVDVLIADEAHRIREISTYSRFAPRRSSGLSQIEDLLRAAKCMVLFIDDYQVVRPKEIGSVEYITRYALRNNCKIFEYELETQFRCAGSDAFVNWINNTLGIRRTANVLWDLTEEFDFRIYDSPFDLEAAIREKSSQGYTARLVAGFCWKWSDPDSEGHLLNDVVLNDFKRPWNAKSRAGRLAPGIPKTSLWASDPNGLNQIGCIYTAQGFEFDYVGVIFGKDLTYDLDSQQWVGHPEHCADGTVRKSKKDKFTDLVKNAYRVLLSRGMKGCYVYFADKDTERFVRSRMEQLSHHDHGSP